MREAYYGSCSANWSQNTRELEAAKIASMFTIIERYEKREDAVRRVEELIKFYEGVSADRFRVGSYYEYFEKEQ